MEQRRKRRLKLSLERLEEWFGSLSEAQADRVGRWAPAWEDDREHAAARLREYAATFDSLSRR